VVDDNADLRGYLRRILGARWQVETAADGEIALQMARHSPPDLVLTDVMMPGLSGFGLLSELKRDARTHSIPVIMLSARAGEEARVEGLDAGADDYLIKPFSARELIARVGSQLALSASYRERAELLERELTARKEADLQKQHVASLFTLAPTPIVILRGPRYVIELANPETCRILGRRYEDVINRPLLEALPELSGQVFASQLDGVISTGVPYMGKETPAEVDRHGNGTLGTVYFNFVFAIGLRLRRDRRGESSRPDAAAARRGGSGQPRKRSVSRDAEPRAAQSARADAHGLAADEAARRRITRATRSGASGGAPHAIGG
jgi:CheY-like chemotaxis protein